jgi:hypothetical protein
MSISNGRKQWKNGSTFNGKRLFSNGLGQCGLLDQAYLKESEATKRGKFLLN